MATMMSARAPEAGDGADGDYFIDTSRAEGMVLHYYGPKAAGAWPAARQVIAHGQIVTGRGAPIAQHGRPGSIYRDTDSGLFHGPKSAVDNTFAAGAHDGAAQVETATVVGTITAAGNVTVVVTAAGLAGSPLTVPVAVALNDTASLVAGKIRAALKLTAAILAKFYVSGTGAAVILTQRPPFLANDATLNVSIDNGTCTGLTTAATSANTTAGVVST